MNDIGNAGNVFGLAWQQRRTPLLRSLITPTRIRVTISPTTIFYRRLLYESMIIRSEFRGNFSRRKFHSKYAPLASVACRLDSFAEASISNWSVRGIETMVELVSGRYSPPLSHSPLDAGRYAIAIDVSSLEAGAYFVRLQWGSRQVIEKIVIAR